MNSLQSAGDESADLSMGPSLRGEPPGLRLGLDDGVRGSLYRDLHTHTHTSESTEQLRFTELNVCVALYFPAADILTVDV